MVSYLIPGLSIGLNCVADFHILHLLMEADPVSETVCLNKFKRQYRMVDMFSVTRRFPEHFSTVS
jgi:hypothetical protein